MIIFQIDKHKITQVSKEDYKCDICDSKIPKGSSYVAMTLMKEEPKYRKVCIRCHNNLGQKF